MVYLSLCIHNHQPAGNFDFVLKDAYKQSYWPFLKTLSRYPSIKLTLHNSGYLLDWIAKNRPEYIDLLGTMVERGQVEVMGGGFYEPILPVIPDEDRIGQISLMSERIELMLGKKPKGMWLAERVWEPTLPTTLVEAGVEYILVDDHHFIKSGIQPEKLSGYYITEDRGKTVKVFPGSELLRYLIPFRSVDEFESELKKLSDDDDVSGIIYGDDGEKFGVWPGTYKWVFEDGWLESFFERISSLDWIKTITLGEYAKVEEPAGKVYLPTTSYMEMGEWSLPTEASGAYRKLNKAMEHEEGGELVRRFLQGGTWRNFFSKYPESNWMHKRMLQVSAALSALKADGAHIENMAEAEESLYRAQANDAYWHGIFGGLYLPHLRGEVYRNIIEAEAMTRAPVKGTAIVVEELDLDADGFDELVLRVAELSLFFSPRAGGALFELDYVTGRLNLCNTLTRWKEAYHGKVGELDSDEHGGGGGTKSIHDSATAKEKGLEEHLVVDTARRGTFKDHFLSVEENLDDFSRNTHAPLSDFHLKPYSVERTKKGFVLEREARVEGFGDSLVKVKKSVEGAGGHSFNVGYVVECDGATGSKEEAGTPEGRLFGVELNFILPCCDGPACFYSFESDEPDSHECGLGTKGVTEGVERVRLVDEHTGIVMSIDLDRAVTLWRYPVYTVSLSEAGFEKIYQGSCLLFLIPFGNTDEAGRVREELKMLVRVEKFVG
jgi:alpha-amylase